MLLGPGLAQTGLAIGCILLSSTPLWSRMMSERPDAPNPTDPVPTYGDAPPPPPPPSPHPAGGQLPGAEKKILAGVLAIVLGALGIHKFVLGYTTEGVIMLVVGTVGSLTCFFCGLPLGWMVMGIIGLIEGIIYLTKTDEEFVRTYIEGKRAWF